MPNPHGTPANLKPFKPGNPGGPGRPSAGASIKEWWNVMAQWELDEVANTANNPRKTVAQRIAAKQILQAARGKGKGDAVDRILDHTDGKARQAVDVTHDGSIRTQSEGESAALGLIAKIAARVGTDAG